MDVPAMHDENYHPNAGPAHSIAPCPENSSSSALGVSNAARSQTAEPSEPVSDEALITLIDEYVADGLDGLTVKSIRKMLEKSLGLAPGTLGKKRVKKLILARSTSDNDNDGFAENDSALGATSGVEAQSEVPSAAAAAAAAATPVEDDGDCNNDKDDGVGGHDDAPVESIGDDADASADVAAPENINAGSYSVAPSQAESGTEIASDELAAAANNSPEEVSDETLVVAMEECIAGGLEGLTIKKVRLTIEARLNLPRGSLNKKRVKRLFLGLGQPEKANEQEQDNDAAEVADADAAAAAAAAAGEVAGSVSVEPQGDSSEDGPAGDDMGTAALESRPPAAQDARSASPKIVSTDKKPTTIGTVTAEALDNALEEVFDMHEMTTDWKRLLYLLSTELGVPSNDLLAAGHLVRSRYSSFSGIDIEIPASQLKAIENMRVRATRSQAQGAAPAASPVAEDTAVHQARSVQRTEDGESGGNDHTEPAQSDASDSDEGDVQEKVSSADQVAARERRRAQGIIDSEDEDEFTDDPDEDEPAAEHGFDEDDPKPAVSTRSGTPPMSDNDDDDDNNNEEDEGDYGSDSEDVSDSDEEEMYARAIRMESEEARAAERTSLGLRQQQDERLKRELAQTLAAAQSARLQKLQAQTEAKLTSVMSKIRARSNALFRNSPSPAVTVEAAERYDDDDDDFAEDEVSDDGEQIHGVARSNIRSRNGMDDDRDGDVATEEEEDDDDDDDADDDDSSSEDDDEDLDELMIVGVPPVPQTEANPEPGPAHRSIDEIRKEREVKKQKRREEAAAVAAAEEEEAAKAEGAAAVDAANAASEAAVGEQQPANDSAAAIAEERVSAVDSNDVEPSAGHSDSSADAAPAAEQSGVVSSSAQASGSPVSPSKRKLAASDEDSPPAKVMASSTNDNNKNSTAGAPSQGSLFSMVTGEAAETIDAEKTAATTADDDDDAGKIPAEILEFEGSSRESNSRHTEGSNEELDAAAESSDDDDVVLVKRARRGQRGMLSRSTSLVGAAGILSSTTSSSRSAFGLGSDSMQGQDNDGNAVRPSPTKLLDETSRSLLGRMKRTNRALGRASSAPTVGGDRRGQGGRTAASTRGTSSSTDSLQFFGRAGPVRLKRSSSMKQCCIRNEGSLSRSGSMSGMGSSSRMASSRFVFSGIGNRGDGNEDSNSMPMPSPRDSSASRGPLTDLERASSSSSISYSREASSRSAVGTSSRGSATTRTKPLKRTPSLMHQVLSANALS